jgi:hypothetical protein
MLKTCAAVIVLVLAQVTLAAEPLATAVKPDYPNLYYIGRFDTTDANGRW